MFRTLIDEIQESQISGSTKKQLKALTRISDLFAAGAGRRSTEQIELFDEVFKTLVGVIETKHGSSSPDISQAMHMRLRPWFAPLPLMMISMWRVRSFSQSTVLGETDLIASASTRGQGHLFAIAQRKTLSEVLTDILVRRGEGSVVRAVTKNAGAPGYRTAAFAIWCCGPAPTRSWRYMSDRGVTFLDTTSSRF